jgi:hypothetical protein
MTKIRIEVFWGVPDELASVVSHICTYLPTQNLLKTEPHKTLFQKNAFNLCSDVTEIVNN